MENDHIFKHHEDSRKIQNFTGKEWKGTVLETSRKSNFKLHKNNSIDNIFAYNHNKTLFYLKRKPQV
jgi:hypothetical protein